MLPYLALVWNAADTRASAAGNELVRHFLAGAPTWRCGLAVPGLLICDCTPAGFNIDEFHPLHHGHGAIIGKLFHQPILDPESSTAGQARLDEHTSASIVASGGMHLLERYWGQYVAFVRNAPEGVTWVLRDPSGGVPCHWTRVSEIDVYFARFEDCARLGLASCSLNPQYLLGYLAYGNVCVRQTGMREIEMVLAGERIEHRQGRRAHKFCWNPLQLGAAYTLESSIEGAQTLRETVRACVHAWTSCFDGVLLYLSGGLDSSIVAACVANSPARSRVLCINEYSPGTESDERRYARVAAHHLGLELIEQERSPECALGSLRQLPRSPYPCPPVDAQQALHQAQLAQRHGLQAAFTGLAGDEIFYSAPLPTSVDYAFRHGLQRRFFSIALEDARVLRCSVWSIARAAVRARLSKRPLHIGMLASLDNKVLLSEDVKAAARADASLWHPLYQEAVDLPPGKLYHCYSVTACTARGYTPGFTPDAPIPVIPLLSQPIMELCLRVPAYVLRCGGSDRAMARRAFASDLPKSVVARRDKGNMQQHMQDVLSRNSHFVRELLLEGILMRDGYLDRQKTRTLLRAEPRQWESHTAEIMEYVCAEAWLQSEWAR